MTRLAKHFRRVGLGTTTAVVLSGAVWGNVFGQVIPAPPEHMRELSLETLEGDVWVYYSAGYRERAEYLQDLSGSAKRYFERPDITGVEMNLGLVVLDADDWAEVIRMPYGMAHISMSPPTAILAATHDDWLTNNNITRKERLPEAFLSRLEDLDLEFEESMRTLTDLLGFHEMGHLFAEHYGAHTWPDLMWLAEFVATYLAYSFMVEERPLLAVAWDIATDALAEGGSVQYTSLADFEELYVRTGDDYGWYQGRFAQRVSEVHQRMGISFIHELKELLVEFPAPPDDDPFRLKQLEGICPGFLDWAPNGDLEERSSETPDW